MLRMKRFGIMRGAGGEPLGDLCVGSFTHRASMCGSCCDFLHPHPMLTGIYAERRATTLVVTSRCFIDQRRLFSTQRHHQQFGYQGGEMMAERIATGGNGKRRAHLAHLSPMFSTLPLEPFGNLNHKQTQLVGRNSDPHLSKKRNKFHRSHPHHELLKTIVNSILNGVSVVLSGPTGSGKSLMAAAVAEEIDRNLRHRQQQHDAQFNHQDTTGYVLGEDQLLCMRREDRVAAGLVPWETAVEEEGAGVGGTTAKALFSDDGLTCKSRRLALYIGSVESNIFLGATPLLPPRAARAYLLLRNTDLPPPTDGTRIFVYQWLKAKVLTMPPQASHLTGTTSTHHGKNARTWGGISGVSNLRRLIGSWGCRLEDDWGTTRGGGGQEDDGLKTIDTTPPLSPSPSLPPSSSLPPMSTHVVAANAAATHDVRIRICATDEAAEQQNAALHMKHMTEVRAVTFSKFLKEKEGGSMTTDGLKLKFSSSNSDLLLRGGAVMRIPLQSTTTWKVCDSNVVLLLIPKKGLKHAGSVDDPSRIINKIPPLPPSSFRTNSTYIQHDEENHLLTPTTPTCQGQGEGHMCDGRRGDDDDRTVEHDATSNHSIQYMYEGEAEGVGTTADIVSSLSPVEQQLSFPEGSSWVLVGDYTPTILHAHGTSTSVSSDETSVSSSSAFFDSIGSSSSSSSSLYGSSTQDEYEVWALRLPRDFYTRLAAQQEASAATSHTDCVQRAILDKMMGRPLLDDGEMGKMLNRNDVSSNSINYSNPSSSTNALLPPPLPLWVHFVMAESFLREFQFKWEQKHEQQQHLLRKQHEERSFRDGGRALQPENSRNGWQRKQHSQQRANDGDDDNDQGENEWSTSTTGDFMYARKNSSNWRGSANSWEERGTNNNDTFGARGMGRGEDRDYNNNTRYDVRDNEPHTGRSVREYPQKAYPATHRSPPYLPSPNTAHHIDLTVGSPVIYRNRLRVVVGFALPPPPAPSSLQQRRDTGLNANTTALRKNEDEEENVGGQPNMAVNTGICVENKATSSSNRFHPYDFFPSPLPILDGGEVVEPQILSKGRQGVEEKEEITDRLTSEEGEQHNEDEWAGDQRANVNNANDYERDTYSPYRGPTRRRSSSAPAATPITSTSARVAHVPYPFAAREVVVSIRLAYAVSARQLLLPPYAATNAPLQPQPQSLPSPQMSRSSNNNKNYNDNKKSRYGESEGVNTEEFAEEGFFSNYNNNNNNGYNNNSTDDHRSGARTSPPTSATVTQSPLSPSCDSIVGLFAHPSSASNRRGLKEESQKDNTDKSTCLSSSFIAELNTMEWLVAGELHHIAASVINIANNDDNNKGLVSQPDRHEYHTCNDERYIGRKSFHPPNQREQQQQQQEAERHPPHQAAYNSPTAHTRYCFSNNSNSTTSTSGLRSPTFANDSFLKKRRQLVAESMRSRLPSCRFGNGVQSINDSAKGGVGAPFSSSVVTSKPRDTLSVGGVVGTDSGALHPLLLLDDRSPLLLRIESLGFGDVQPTHSPLYLL